MNTPNLQSLWATSCPPIRPSPEVAARAPLCRGMATPPTPLRSSSFEGSATVTVEADLVGRRSRFGLRGRAPPRRAPSPVLSSRAPPCQNAHPRRRRRGQLPAGPGRRAQAQPLSAQPLARTPGDNHRAKLLARLAGCPIARKAGGREGRRAACATQPSKALGSGRRRGSPKHGGRFF